MPSRLKAGIERIRAKSLALTQYLMDLMNLLLPGAESDGASFGNPQAASSRGGHVSVIHPEAGRICRALRDKGVITDHRAPNIVRLAPVPLYNTFAECHEAVLRLREVLDERTFERYPLKRALVP